MSRVNQYLLKFKDDIDTTMRYYDQALIAKPDDNITINNIEFICRINLKNEKIFHKAFEFR
jgi:hypothetical protein